MNPGAAATHASRSKFFRIAVEGATTDGRTIQRAWIEQMAANYSPQRYGARVNLEHFRGIVPDGPFKAYGDVLALEAREETGEFDGKLGLYAQISPTSELVTLTKARQKIYTSCEIDPSFADTKQAYLVGLAVTDSPASLGTEVLTFAAQHPQASPFAQRKLSPDNLFSAAVEAAIELDEAAEPPGPSLFARIGEILGFARQKAAQDDTRFADIAQAVEALATHGSRQAASFAKLAQTVAALGADIERDRTAFVGLRTQLYLARDDRPGRPAATGGDGAVKTDC